MFSKTNISSDASRRWRRQATAMDIHQAAVLAAVSAGDVELVGAFEGQNPVEAIKMCRE
jgi:hypothetical protein